MTVSKGVKLVVKNIKAVITDNKWAVHIQLLLKCSIRGLKLALKNSTEKKKTCKQWYMSS